MFNIGNNTAGIETVCDMSNLEQYLDGPSDYKELAFLGRSNVGKSTLINTLLGTQSLLKSSKTPGKTKHLHFVRLKSLETTFVDCPGYGFAEASV